MSPGQPRPRSMDRDAMHLVRTLPGDTTRRIDKLLADFCRDKVLGEWKIPDRIPPVHHKFSTSKWAVVNAILIYFLQDLDEAERERAIESGMRRFAEELLGNVAKHRRAEARRRREQDRAELPDPANRPADPPDEASGRPPDDGRGRRRRTS